MRRLGAGRLEHMQDAPIRPAEGGGHPVLAGEAIAQGRPALADAVRAQALIIVPAGRGRSAQWTLR